MTTLLILVGLGTAHANLDDTRTSERCTAGETDPLAVGSGTLRDPWQICTAEQLEAMPGLSDEEHEDSYLLVDDLDLSGIEWTQGIGDCGLGWSVTVGGFSGTFDGGGHTLEGLSGPGLFECINGGEVYDLHIDGFRTSGTYFFHGTVADQAYMADISDVQVTDSDLGGYGYVGGIVGWARYSDLDRVSFQGSITGGSMIGGIAGHVHGGTLQDSYATGSMDGSWNVGGLIGVANGMFRPVVVERSHAAFSWSEDTLAEQYMVGLLVGRTLGDADQVQLGRAGDDELNALVGLAAHDLPVVGDGDYSGTAVGLERSLYLDPDTYERAGWDLDTVWNAPTRARPPTLR